MIDLDKLSEIIKRRKAEFGISEDNIAPKAAPKSDSLTLDEIFGIDDHNNLVIELYMHICYKSDYGEDTLGLSEAEKTLLVTNILEAEVNNGGFSQFFFNSSGEFAHETVAAFKAIGAEKTAAICERAVTAFGVAIPKDREQRNDLLDNLWTDEIEDILSECDDKFYDYEDNLAELNYEYIMKNKADFT